MKLNPWTYHVLLIEICFNSFFHNQPSLVPFNKNLQNAALSENVPEARGSMLTTLTSLDSFHCSCVHRIQHQKLLLEHFINN